MMLLKKTSAYVFVDIRWCAMVLIRAVQKDHPIPIFWTLHFFFACVVSYIVGRCRNLCKLLLYSLSTGMIDSASGDKAHPILIASTVQWGKHLCQRAVVYIDRLFQLSLWCNNNKEKLKYVCWYFFFVYASITGGVVLSCTTINIFTKRASCRTANIYIYPPDPILEGINTSLILSRNCNFITNLSYAHLVTWTKFAIRLFCDCCI